MYLKIISFNKKSVVTKFKSELISVVILFFLFLLILKIVLYKENTMILLLVVLKFFYAVILPGLFISSCLYRKLSFTARFVLGSVFTIASISIISYYLGLIGLHVKYHPYILPPSIMLSGVLLFLRNKQT